MTQVGNAVGCAQGAALALAGQYGGGTTIGAFLTISGLPEPLRRLTLLTATTLTLQPPAAFTPNYTLLKGKLNLLGTIYDWEFTNYARLNKLFAGFNAYESTVINQNLTCSLAGSETAFNSNLGSFTSPILALEAGHGIGPYMADTLAALGTSSGNKTIISTPGRAHGDHYTAADHMTYVENPLIAFLQSVFP